MRADRGSSGMLDRCCALPCLLRKGLRTMRSGVPVAAATFVGVVINDDGDGVTNHHVIQGETRIAAVLYQNVPSGLARRRIENVEIVALNPFVDLALLKLPPQPDLKLSHVVLGSLEDLNAGDG